MVDRRWLTAEVCVLAVLWCAAARGSMSPAKAERVVARARVLAARGRTQEAIAELHEVFASIPDHVDAHLLYVDLRSRSARAVVREEYRRRLAEQPRSGLLHFVAGYATDDAAERLRLYRQAVVLAPGLYRAQVALGRLLRSEPVEDTAGSVRAMAAAVGLRPGSAAARVELARSLEAGGRADDAVLALERAVALDARHEAAWVELVRLVGAARSRAREAGQVAQRAVGACPRSGRLWWAFADLRWAEGRYADAEPLLEKALRYGAKADYAAQATERLAARYLMRGHYRSARRLDAGAHADAIAEMAGRRLSGEAFRLLYDAEQGAGDEALAALERASRLAPTSALVARALAGRYLAAGRFAEAASAYTALGSLRPDDPEARARAGAALLLAGDAAAAVRVLRADGVALSRRGAWVLADAEAVAAGTLARAAVAARHAAGGRPEALRACAGRFPDYLTPRVELAYALRAAGRSAEAGRVLEGAADVAGHAVVAADRHALLGERALAGLYLARAIEHYRKATALAPATPRYYGGLARALVERGEFGPARAALARQLELAPDAYDLAGGEPEREGDGYLLEPRLEPGDVLRYRYTTDGGQPGDRVSVEFAYAIDAVQPGGLVEATLEPVSLGGRPVDGGGDFVGARVSVTCSSAFGLVDVGEPPGGPPREFVQLLWLVQFIHGPALPVARWPGQRWREPAWAELGRLYGGAVHFARVRRGRAQLVRSIAYEKPANGASAPFEVMAVTGRAELGFDLARRALERAEVTTHITLRDEHGSEARLPPWTQRLELLGVERGARPAGRRQVIRDVPYVKQVGPKCAAAALAMVFRRFGREVDQEALFRELGGRSGGVHVHALPAAARRRGFEAHPHMGTLATLKRHLGAGAPVIVFLTPMGMGHAVVAIGYDDARGEVVLHDPATAPYKRVSYARFEREWRESDRSCMVVVPAGDARFARLDYPREEAVAALLEGDRLFRQQRLGPAEAAYRRALERFGGYTEAHLALVRCLVADKRLDDARAEADALIAARPDNLAAKIAKADVLVLQHHYREAITLARGVEARDPTNLRNLNVLATAYVHSGQRDQAVAILERAVRYAPAWTNVRVRLAALYFLRGRYDSAAQQYRAALDHEPRNTRVLYLLAATLHQCLRDDGRRELAWPRRRQHAADAVAALEAIRDVEGPSCETSAELAQLYDLLGNGPAAIRLLQRSVRERTLSQLRRRQDLPSDADPFSFLGSVSAAVRGAVARVGAWAQAQRERATNLNNLAWAYATRGERLDEARQLAVQSVARREAGFNLDTLAWIDYQLGSLDAARRAFERAVQLQPDPVVRIHLALTCQKLGDEAAADEHLREAFALNRPAAEVHLELAEACAQVGLRDRELEALEAAVAADPRHRRARYRLALALLARGRAAARVRAIAEALHRADPDDPLYAGLLGAACQLDGESRRARRLLARALAADPLLGTEPSAPYRYFLGRDLLAAGERPQAMAELRRCRAAAPKGPFAARAQRLLDGESP